LAQKGEVRSQDERQQPLQSWPFLDGTFRLGADGQVSRSDDGGRQNLTFTGAGKGRRMAESGLDFE
jgi:hypothetical protein